eukprot:CAMPEP_0194699558 /NCGR_PEP_ID=MMETSP0295-20121207/24906_1 /TAXON_ID=39354 /ORGANISM="Heterosigma akashiwo, Strain CCMP2393" /LENGTH=243 /DNA_ID=CAMNT_0039593069 /DNA_START=128 /DNA_END=855 /DNA_ORIENTATION=-
MGYSRKQDARIKADQSIDSWSLSKSEKFLGDGLPLPSMAEEVNTNRKVSRNGKKVFISPKLNHAIFPVSIPSHSVSTPSSPRQTPRRSSVHSRGGGGPNGFNLHVATRPESMPQCQTGRGKGVSPKVKATRYKKREPLVQLKGEQSIVKSSPRPTNESLNNNRHSVADRVGYISDIDLLHDDDEDGTNKGTNKVPNSIWDGKKAIAAALVDKREFDEMSGSSCSSARNLALKEPFRVNMDREA